MLLVHRNTLVTTDRLVDELFPGGDPDGGVRSLRVAILRLRRLLEGGDETGVIVTQPGGYLIRTVPDQLDADRFERLVEQGRAARAADDPMSSAMALREALSLWRGSPLADLSMFDFAQGETRRLEETQIGALMNRIDADLILGRSAELVPEIEALVSAHPLQERLREQLMLALYRSGRQADALDAYRRASVMFRDQLGLEPGASLRDLERAILNQEASLELPGAPGRSHSAEASDASLPAEVGRASPSATTLPRADRRVRRSRIIAASVLLAAGGVALGVLLTRPSGGEQRAAADGIIAIDPRAARIVAQIDPGARPAQIALSGRDVWVMNADEGAVVRIDARTRQVTDTVPTSLTPTDIAAANGALFIANKKPGTAGENLGLPFAVSRYDLNLGADTFTAVLPHKGVVPLSGAPPGELRLAVGGGYVWAIAPDLGVVQLDERTGHAVRRLNFHALSLVFAEHDLWLLDNDASDVLRVNPHSGQIVQRVEIPPTYGGTSLAVGGGAVWVAVPLAGVVWKLEPDSPGSPVSISDGVGASVVAYGDGAAWVGNDVLDTVSRINPASDTITATVGAPAPQAITVGDGLVWVSSGSGAGRSGPLVEAGCGRTVGPAHADVRIVSDLALEGTFSPYTLPAERAILRVLSDAHYRAGRFTVAYQGCDDGTPTAGGPDAGRCSANAQAYAADLSIVAVIGPSSSDCALAEIPVSSRAPHGPLAFITPMATESVLSRHMLNLPPDFLSENYPHGTGNFLRTVGDEHIQVAADAELAKQVGLHRVLELSTPNEDGFTTQTQAAWFAYASRRLHGPSTLSIRLTPATTAKTVASTAKTVASLIRSQHADGLFIPTYAPNAVAIVRAVRAAFGRRFAIITSDGNWPWPYFVQAVGPAADGVYGSYGGYASPTDLPPNGRAILRAVGGPTLTVVTAAAATQAVLAAIARSNGTRRSVLQHLENLRLPQSTAGPLAFNKAGELVTAPITIYRLRRGARNDSDLRAFQDATIDRVITPPAFALAPP